MFSTTTTFVCEHGHEITLNGDYELTDLNECPFHPSLNPWPNIWLESRFMVRIDAEPRP